MIRASRARRIFTVRAGLIAVLAVATGSMVASSPTAPSQNALRQPARIDVAPNSQPKERAPSTSALSITAAMERATPGAVIYLEAGTYPPFTVSVPGVTVVGVPGTRVQGRAGYQNVVTVTASDVTLDGITVAGCVPDPDPPGGFDHGASAGVRVVPGTRGVTLTRLTVTGGAGLNNDGLRFGCYGILLQGTEDAAVTDSEVSGNGYGISVDGNGRGSRIVNNTVHDNDVLVKNTAGVANDDFGAVGIGFGNAHGVTAMNNEIYNNAGPSHDWGTDGGGFEIYDSSDVDMLDNTIWNNDGILETGASASGSCRDNVFSGNTATGRTPQSKLTTSVGMVLRCASNMEITNNKIQQVDWWAFWIYQRTDAGSGGSVSGLSISHNVINQNAAQIYSIGSLSPSRLNIYDNLYTYGSRFASVDYHQINTLTEWKTETGFDTSAGS